MKTTTYILVCCVALSFLTCAKESPYVESNTNMETTPVYSNVYVLEREMDSNYVERLHFEAVMKGYAFPHSSK